MNTTHVQLKKEENIKIEGTIVKSNFIIKISL